MAHTVTRRSRVMIPALVMLLLGQAGCLKADAGGAPGSAGRQVAGSTRPDAMVSGGDTQRVRLGKETFKLTARDGRCVLFREGASAAEIRLTLAPPCHVLLWRSRPPTKPGGSSGGVPVGEIGSAMAWRYASAGGATVLAVIGDPLQGDLKASFKYRQRKQQGFHCAGSVQGVLIDGARTRVGRKREQVGVLCAESGLDEKGFWLLAHPK